MPKAVALTQEQYRKLHKRAFWRAYGALLFGDNRKTRRILGLMLLSAALGKLLTTPALAGGAL